MYVLSLHRARNTNTHAVFSCGLRLRTFTWHVPRRLPLRRPLGYIAHRMWWSTCAQAFIKEKGLEIDKVDEKNVRLQEIMDELNAKVLCFFQSLLW
jgi:hypothetical protein